MIPYDPGLYSPYGYFCTQSAEWRYLHYIRNFQGRGKIEGYCSRFPFIQTLRIKIIHSRYRLSKLSWFQVCLALCGSETRVILGGEFKMQADKPQHTGISRSQRS